MKTLDGDLATQRVPMTGPRIDRRMEMNPTSMSSGKDRERGGGGGGGGGEGRREGGRERGRSKQMERLLARMRETE